MSKMDQSHAELIQDFVSEASELIESVDQDLVTLEQTPDDRDLLARIFRALHTIKGSSSFLALDELTSFAHAAEDALNALRKGETRADSQCMDALLKAADVVRHQIDAIAAGEPLPAGPTDLIDQLHAIAECGPSADNVEPAEADATSAGDGGRMLVLPDSKLELLPFMVEDLTESLERVAGQLADYTPGQGATITDAVDELLRSAEFFEVQTIVDELNALHDAIVSIQSDEQRAGQVVPVAQRLVEALSRRTEALAERRLIDMDTATIRRDLAAAADDSDSTAEPASNAPADASQERASGNEESANTARGERTIRVDVDRLESLLNLVGELVLQKNRVAAIGRRLGTMRVDPDLVDELDQTGSDLDRVTADLQMSVMKTRMQPLSKLFNRYPRMVRDLARSTDKQIRLEVTGGDTEVDKSVLEGLADPLVHILRNSGDHGIESTDDRTAAGKDPCGTIRITAGHEGSHVIVEVADDGRGLDPKKIGDKALKMGLVTAEQLQAMTDRDIHNLIFRAGFSTAANVSNISGRGVGMDVVRSNIVKLNGLVDVRSELGGGSTVSIRIPLTVAIMPAMMVRVGVALYALPLANVVEILRLETSQIRSVGGHPTLRVRDRVLPIVHLPRMFNATDEYQNAQVAVVVALGEKRIVLLVIKPIDDCIGHGGLVSGATVRDDGGVSLILDVPAIFETLHGLTRRAA